MDVINIKKLEVFANHGVLKEENALGQKFLVSAALNVDTREAGKSDALDKSINYAVVCDEIRSYLTGNTFKLIETVAEGLAEHLLLSFNRLKVIKLEVIKPWAPIKQSLEYVSVEIERGWQKAYLSLGSNIGDTKAYLEAAIKSLGSVKECRVTKVSPFYTTKPVGNVDQADFLNCALEIETLYSPHELLAFINKIEAQNGRERKVHWGPRTLDIDIVLYGNSIINDDVLTIPHIEMANRYFVLKPLKDIAPYAINPALNQSVLQMYNGLNEAEKC